MPHPGSGRFVWPCPSSLTDPCRPANRGSTVQAKAGVVKQSSTNLKFCPLKIHRFATILLFTALFISGCAHNRPPSTSSTADVGSESANWLAIYTNAVLDASNATLDKVSTELTAVSLANTNLFWRTNADGILQLKVASFMGYATATNYYLPGQHTLNNHDIWVTICPDLQTFCHTNQIVRTNQVFRLIQLLGLPPACPYNTVVEFWISPDYLFRPTAEPAINSISAGLSTSASTPLVSTNFRTPAFWPAWYNGNYSTRYSFSKGINNAYPYAQLGYTYDWSPTRPNHHGVSEFVILGINWTGVTRPVTYEVVAIQPAATYGK